MLCTKYFSKVYGIGMQGNAMETLADLLWWYDYLQSRYGRSFQAVKWSSSTTLSAGLKLQTSKCELIQSEVLYLGHVVGKEGIKPNPKITEPIKNWKAPQNVKQVQQFFGLCNYYRQFIHKFSKTTTPLSSLTKQDKKFVWSGECKESFLFLKTALSNAPVRAYPSSLKPLFLTQMRRMTE